MSVLSPISYWQSLFLKDWDIIGSQCLSSILGTDRFQNSQLFIFWKCNIYIMEHFLYSLEQHLIIKYASISIAK